MAKRMYLWTARQEGLATIVSEIVVNNEKNESWFNDYQHTSLFNNVFNETISTARIWKCEIDFDNLILPYTTFRDTYEAIDFVKFMKKYVLDAEVYMFAFNDNSHACSIVINKYTDEFYQKHAANNMSVEIDNLTYDQYMALKALFYKMQMNGNVGHSESMTFFCDSDGNYRPKIKIDGQEIDFKHSYDDSYLLYRIPDNNTECYIDQDFAKTRYFALALMNEFKAQKSNS